MSGKMETECGCRCLILGWSVQVDPNFFGSLHCLSSRIIGVLPWSTCNSYMTLITDQVDSKTSRLVAFESNVLTGASHFKTSSKSNIMETSSAEWWTEWTREWASSVDERMGEQSGWTSGWTSGQAEWMNEWMDEQVNEFKQTFKEGESVKGQTLMKKGRV